MRRLLYMVVFAALLSMAVALKEWKNFENGKVYSHKTLSDGAESESRVTRAPPLVPERLLHSHHRDKKLKINSQQSTETKPLHGRNPERHHRKNAEEEMHLRPLNERHHKFPNPALLNPNRDPDQPSQVTKQTLMKQGKQNIRRSNKHRERGRKRNKPETKPQPDQENTSETNQLMHDIITTRKPYSKASNNMESQNTRFRSGFPSKLPSYW